MRSSGARSVTHQRVAKHTRLKGTAPRTLPRRFPPRTIPMPCRHCEDELLDDCPPDVTSCRSYANRRARQAGDMLTEDESHDLTVLWVLCSISVAIRDGWRRCRN